MRLLTTISALAVASGGAFAQSDDALIKGVTTSDMAALIVDAGHTVEKVTNEGKSHHVQAKTDAGFMYFLAGQQCDATSKCKGLELISVFTAEPKVTLEEMNDINRNYAAASLSRQNERFVLSRYLILDHGMTRENIKLNMTVYQTIAGQVSEKLEAASKD